MSLAESLDPEKLEARRQTRWAWKLGGATLVLALAGFIGVLVFYDIAPQDDADMLPPPREEGAPNPLEDLVKTLQAHPIGDIKQLHEAEKSNSLTQKYEQAIQAYQNLTKTDPAHWRWPSLSQSQMSEADFSDATGAFSLGKVIHLQIQNEPSTNPSDTFQRSLSLIQFGHSLGNTHGTLVHYIVAITLQRLGEATLESSLTKSEVTSESIIQVQQELSQLEPTREAFINTLRVEYAYGKAITEAYARGKEFPLDPSIDLGAYPAPLDRWFFKPNMTMKLRLDTGRPLIRALESSWSQALTTQERNQQAIAKLTTASLRLYLNPNMTGMLTRKLALENEGNILSRTASGAALHRLTLLQLALRRFELQHGKLPASLQELAPEFISQVPTDPFDDQPLRWDLGHKRLYSLGTNRKDDGGDFGASGNVHEPDLGMHYWWGEEAIAARQPKPAEPPKKKRLTAPITPGSATPGK